MDLIADIGATNSRCGLVGADGRIDHRETFENHAFADPASLLQAFVSKHRLSESLERAAIAIAAPVTGDRIEMLNRDWHFRQSALAHDLGVGQLVVVNDFTALAWSLPWLDDAARLQVGDGRPAEGCAVAVIGPGSGLGVGGLIPSAEDWAAISGEGGHVSVAPATPLEARIVESVRSEFGHCSAERLLSGPGLVRLHRELGRIRGDDRPADEPAEVTARAQQGDALAVETLEVFFGLLGAAAGDLALTLGARGGVFIGGGIVPRIRAEFVRSRFRERFVSKGRYRSYLDAIPTWLITDPIPAFTGLKILLGYPRAAADHSMASS